jgi:hypothetical protein
MASLFPFIICVNASRGPKGSGVGLRRKVLHGKEDTIRQNRELYNRKRAKQREQVELGSASNVECLQAIDAKECMFEIQAVMLRKLAAEENRLKGLSEAPGPAVVDFDLLVKEVEEALAVLKFRY